MDKAVTRVRGRLGVTSQSTISPGGKGNASSSLDMWELENTYRWPIDEMNDVRKGERMWMGVLAPPMRM